MNPYLLAFAFVRGYPRLRLRRLIRRYQQVLTEGYTKITDAASEAARSIDSFAAAWQEAEQREFIRIQAANEADNG